LVADAKHPRWPSYHPRVHQILHGKEAADQLAGLIVKPAIDEDDIGVLISRISASVDKAHR
jgi:hypothetical protein